MNPPTGYRKNCLCPRCNSAERHRLQKLVCDRIFENFDPSNASILHFAPEPYFAKYFRSKFLNYTSADLLMKNVDVKCDMTELPFEEGTFDFIFASHVLEHISDDMKALSEIKRILKPGKSIAVLPVPIVCEETVEYLEPNPLESEHIRAPGKDYFERYMQYFSNVQIFTSSDFPEKYQTFIYEVGNSLGEKRDDFVPVCFL
jgi:SAM-dependent methyltransferase